LGCHTPLADRLVEDAGFHATVADDDCASCHKEHFGPDFALVRFDTASFEHDLAGYVLEGRHAEAGCRACHRREWVAEPAARAFKAEHGALDRTFLGLPTDCVSCHAPADPHGDQFGDRACTECHDTDGWEGAAGFDHAQTAYPLTGEHVDVGCTGCHVTTPRPGQSAPFVQYIGVQAELCTDCHGDEHEGIMPGRCTSCHDTGGWLGVDRTLLETTFDHTRTGFALEGVHDAASCSSCHDRRAIADLEWIQIGFVAGTESDPYPSPITGACLSCHVDRHPGVFVEAGVVTDCVNCHTPYAWHPADYDIARHNAETGYALEGAHVLVACVECHVPSSDAPLFEVEGTACVSCHATVDPHEDQFANRDCAQCHEVSGFRIRDFDHEATRYPLDGAHEEVECTACHATEATPSGDQVVRYRPLGMLCRDCHGDAR
jgi:predicted CXXCH cytochrome family protein